MEHNRRPHTCAQGAIGLLAVGLLAVGLLLRSVLHGRLRMRGHDWVLVRSRGWHAGWVLLRAIQGWGQDRRLHAGPRKQRRGHILLPTCMQRGHMLFMPAPASQQVCQGIFALSLKACVCRILACHCCVGAATGGRPGTAPCE